MIWNTKGKVPTEIRFWAPNWIFLRGVVYDWPSYTKPFPVIFPSKHIDILINPSPQNILFPDELQALFCSVIISLHHELIELCDRRFDVSTRAVSTSEVIVKRRSLFHIDKYSSFKSWNTPIESEEPDPPVWFLKNKRASLGHSTDLCIHELIFWWNTPKEKEKKNQKILWMLDQC